MGMSLAQHVREVLRSDGEAAALAILGELTEQEQEQALQGAWWFTRRPEQAPPDGAWRWWLVQAGRGWG